MPRSSFVKIHDCDNCEYTTDDASNARKHKISCQEKKEKYGGVVDCRSKYFKEACKISKTIDNTLLHTFEQMQILMQSDVKGTKNIVINNNITVNQNIDASIKNSTLNNTTNNNTINVTFQNSEGQHVRVNDMDKPNLSYLETKVLKWIDDVAILAQQRLLMQNKEADEPDLSSDEEEIVINGKSIKPKRQPKAVYTTSENDTNSKVTGLNDFAKAVSSVIVELHDNTFFDSNHPENHSIRMKNRNRPNKSLEYIKDGKWQPIEKEELYTACLQICKHSLHKILRNNSLYILEDNVQEILDYEGENEEEKAAMKEHQLQGIERNTIKNNSGSLASKLVNDREFRELKAFNRERFARKKRGERCDNLYSDEEREIWEIAKKNVDQEDIVKRMEGLIVRTG